MKKRLIFLKTILIFLGNTIISSESVVAQSQWLSAGPDYDFGQDPSLYTTEVFIGHLIMIMIRSSGAPRLIRAN